MNVWEIFHEKITLYGEIFVNNLPRVTAAVVLLATFIVLATLFSRVLKRRMKLRGTDSIVITFFIRLAKAVFIVIGSVLALQLLGFTMIAGGIMASAGVGAVVLGFAFKEIGENFLAGIILVFNRPFRAGDTVTINNMMGVVMGLKFRTTHIKSFDGRDIFVPNGAVIRNNLYNHTQDGLLRLEFLIGIDYDDNVEDAVALIIDVIQADPDVLRTEESHVLIDEFAINTVNLRVMFWINTVDYKIGSLLIKSRIMARVKAVLQKNKFGLPANIQEIKLHREDPLPITLQTEDGQPPQKPDSARD